MTSAELWSNSSILDGFNIMLRLASMIQDRYENVNFIDNAITFSSGNSTFSLTTIIDKKSALPKITIEMISGSDYSYILKDVINLIAFVKCSSLAPDIILARIENLLECYEEYSKSDYLDEDDISDILDDDDDDDDDDDE